MSECVNYLDWSGDRAFILAMIVDSLEESCVRFVTSQHRHFALIFRLAKLVLIGSIGTVLLLVGAHRRVANEGKVAARSGTMEVLVRFIRWTRGQFAIDVLIKIDKAFHDVNVIVEIF